RESAARYAAIAAADSMTPREVREVIDLDPSAPLFARGMALIDAGRLRDARALWEGLLVQNPSSAPLLYDVAAVSEAAGDPDAAAAYLERAIAAAPGDRKYRDALAMFRRRNGR